MPTRSRAGSSRTKKSSSPLPNGYTPTGTTPEVTGGTLQRRELPSLSESREARIAEAAYWRAERRGFQAGHELDDWLEAEKEVDSKSGAPPDGRTG